MDGLKGKSWMLRAHEEVNIGTICPIYVFLEREPTRPNVWLPFMAFIAESIVLLGYRRHSECRRYLAVLRVLFRLVSGALSLSIR
ncbi:hypothetical protein BJX66DRAFT_229925 [Aspergillus keveii]|uniref:Uncharacterized protein n=1 Tax=Aspergillus keveii TaxID=714993 RepID=A0ABR4GLC4_9EURO